MAQMTMTIAAKVRRPLIILPGTPAGLCAAGAMRAVRGTAHTWASDFSTLSSLYISCLALA